MMSITRSTSMTSMRGVVFISTLLIVAAGLSDIHRHCDRLCSVRSAYCSSFRGSVMKATFEFRLLHGKDHLPDCFEARVFVAANVTSGGCEPLAIELRNALTNRSFNSLVSTGWLFQ